MNDTLTARLDVQDAARDMAVDMACESLYRLLSAALSEPNSSSWPLAFDRANLTLAQQAADYLREEFVGSAAPLGFGELPPDALDVHALTASAAEPADVATDYLRVFGLVNCRECPPYETEYQPIEDTFFRSQQMADIAGFYQAFGLQLADNSRERPDHVALELEFIAHLLAKKRAAGELAEEPLATSRAEICQRARLSFFRDHLAWWIPSFSLALRKKAETGFYEAAARLLAALIALERARLGIRPPQMPLVAAVEAPEDCEGCQAMANA